MDYILAVVLQSLDGLCPRRVGCLMTSSLIAKLQDILCKIEYCAITTDGWTSKANTNYLTITCHFISDFELKLVVLSTMPLVNEHNHTGQNIAHTLELALNEWHIFNEVVAIVTDNAATMLNACKLELSSISSMTQNRMNSIKIRIVIS